MKDLLPRPLRGKGAVGQLLPLMFGWVLLARLLWKLCCPLERWGLLRHCKALWLCGPLAGDRLRACKAYFPGTCHVLCPLRGVVATPRRHLEVMFFVPRILRKRISKNSRQWLKPSWPKPRVSKTRRVQGSRSSPSARRGLPSSVGAKGARAVVGNCRLLRRRGCEPVLWNRRLLRRRGSEPAFRQHPWRGHLPGAWGQVRAPRGDLQRPLAPALRGHLQRLAVQALRGHLLRMLPHPLVRIRWAHALLCVQVSVGKTSHMMIIGPIRARRPLRAQVPSIRT